MTPEFGNIALILALCMALAQTTLPLVGTLNGNQNWVASARPAAYGQLFFLLVSFACLCYAFLSNDFSVAYVAENSNSLLPKFYRFAAVWGAHEGSMLLWVTILSLWTTAVAFCSRSLPDETVARVISILGMISIGFLCFLLFTSNPFLRTLPNIPVDGADLNPMLQDIGLIIHPPMLYMGYVGFAVPFAFAIASLIGGHLDSSWAKWIRPWSLVAWAFLSFGITLGSWWAYRELGWGGWWFWDPVENASLLPWLVGTALLHSLIVSEKRDTFKAWTVFLAISAFSLSLLGTFLVRSGVITSVHAFASDPTRGVFMLFFLFIVIGSSLLLYAWRGTTVRDEGRFDLLSRETLLLGNNVIFVVVMATVLLGTLYPLLVEALGYGKLSVGLPYFNAVVVPIMMPLFFLMGLGPHTQWRSMPVDVLIRRLSYSFVLSIIAATVLPIIFGFKLNGYVILGLSAAFWVFSTTLQYAWRHKGSHLGMVLAHLGVAVCITGITLTVAYNVERDVRMAPGDSVTAGPYTFLFEGVNKVEGPNYLAAEGEFKISKDGEYVSTLNAQKRFYKVKQMSMTDADVDAGVFRDLYVALGEQLENDAWSVRVYYKPFIRWIWAGGILMLLGGLLAAGNKRYRKHKRVESTEASHAITES